MSITRMKTKRRRMMRTRSHKQDNKLKINRSMTRRRIIRRGGKRKKYDEKEADKMNDNEKEYYEKVDVFMTRTTKFE